MDPSAAAIDARPRFTLRDVILQIAVFAALWIVAQAFFWMVQLPSPLLAAVLFTATLHLLFLVLSIVQAKRNGGEVRRWILGRESSKEAIIAFWLVVATVAVMLLAYASVWLAWGIVPPSRNRSNIYMAPLWARICLVSLSVLLAPLSEELVYRGVWLDGLKSRFGLVVAAVLQAGVFAAVHRETWPYFIFLFGVGLIMAALVQWRGCLAPAIAAHCGINAMYGSWMIALLFFNAHTPAATMEEASRAPPWQDQSALIAIPDHASAQEQFHTAQQYGSRGFQLWKDEVRAFNKVRKRFPDNEEYNAKSLLGIQQIYLHHLDDPYRSIAVGEELQSNYMAQQDLLIESLLASAEAYIEIGAADQARRVIQRVLELAGDDPRVSRLSERLLERSGD